MYRIGVFDCEVELPDELSEKRYDDIGDACEDICNFVHSFDGKESVNGRVMDVDCEDEDVAYFTSNV